MITISEYKKICNPAKSKYNSKITIIDGIRFHSKKEAEYYSKLKLYEKEGHIHRIHRQVIFDLPGPSKYLCDFMIIYFEPKMIDYIDCKGYDTPLSKLKRKQVKDLYGIEIKII